MSAVLRSNDHGAGDVLKTDADAKRLRLYSKDAQSSRSFASGVRECGQIRDRSLVMDKSTKEGQIGWGRS